MGTMTVRFYANPSAIRAMYLPSGIVGSAVRNAGETTVRRVQRAITAAGRVRTGAMRAGIKRGPLTVGSNAVTQQVTGSAHYTDYQDRGTRYITGAYFFRTGVQQLRPSDFRPN